MRRAVILSMDDLRHITMIKLYTEYFEKNDISYDIICLNRYAENEVKYANQNVKVFSYKGTNVGDSKIKKAFNYIKYRNYAINIINNNHYDYIIVWGERTAPVFSDYLKKHKPYCVNIRDIGFPNVPLFYRRLKDAIDNSDFTTWCAPRGLEELPKHNYVLVYNLNKNIVKGATVAKSLISHGERIHLGTIGYIRHQDAARQIMKAFCNDERFIIQFYGTGAEKLLPYAEEINMKNIDIIGTFKPEETPQLLDRIDIINSYCGDGSQDKTIAIGTPIRYGYSTMLYKPALVSPNTYISEKTNELGIAFTANNLDSLPDQLYSWYYSLDFDSFVKGCKQFNDEVYRTIQNLYDVCDKKVRPILRGEI